MRLANIIIKCLSIVALLCINCQKCVYAGIDSTKMTGKDWLILSAAETDKNVNELPGGSVDVIFTRKTISPSDKKVREDVTEKYQCYFKGLKYHNKRIYTDPRIDNRLGQNLVGIENIDYLYDGKDWYIFETNKYKGPEDNPLKTNNRSTLFKYFDTSLNFTHQRLFHPVYHTLFLRGGPIMKFMERVSSRPSAVSEQEDQVIITQILGNYKATYVINKSLKHFLTESFMIDMDTSETMTHNIYTYKMIDGFVVPTTRSEYYIVPGQVEVKYLMEFNNYKLNIQLPDKVFSPASLTLPPGTVLSEFQGEGKDVKIIGIIGGVPRSDLNEIALAAQNIEKEIVKNDIAKKRPVTSVETSSTLPVSSPVDPISSMHNTTINIMIKNIWAILLLIVGAVFLLAFLVKKSKKA